MLSEQVSVEHAEQSHSLTYGSRYLRGSIPKYFLPEESMPAEVAYQIIHDELNLDGNPALNVASFCTTWMESKANKLIMETLDKNYIDQDEYPVTTEIQNRCVNMLAHLFHSPKGSAGVGTGTVGSSEAIHLAGLALKWKWRKAREAAGKPSDKPNIVMGHNVQVCWEKFARYFDVEPRYVPMTKERYVIDPEEAVSMVDENTIVVVGILGSTYTGEYEPIEQLNDALMDMNAKKGWDVGIHVDGASGGFVAPFLSPDLKWDFQLPLVKSINVSGHKYGLVYPGVGWVIWRDKAELPDELIFHVDYLGGDQPTFNLNFSRGASQILAQYYNFLSLGIDGYTRIMKALHRTANYLTDQLEAMNHFNILSDRNALPVVAFSLKDESKYTVFDISAKLRERGWIVPAYHMAPNAQEVSLLRIVVREGMSHDMADMMVEDIQRTIKHLEEDPPRITREPVRKKTRGVC